MSIYRDPAPAPKLAPPTPWWRLLRAWWYDLDRRLEARRDRHRRHAATDRYFAALAQMKVWGGEGYTVPRSGPPKDIRP